MIRAALAYFAVVFGVGFLLGAVRVPVVVPLVGDRAAELIEAPLLLAAIVLAARWVGRRFGRPDAPGRMLGTGLVAAGLVLAADLAVGVGLRGLTPAQVFTGRDPVAGAVYYSLVAAFAVLPWLFHRAARPGS